MFDLAEKNFQGLTWQRKTVTRRDVRAGQEVAGSKKDTWNYDAHYDNVTDVIDH